MTQHEMQIAYFKSALSQHPGGEWEAPKYVPKRVRVINTVRSDLAMFLPGPHPSVSPGVYEVTCNKYGAVSVVTPDGPLGLKPAEFEIVERMEVLR